MGLESSQSNEKNQIHRAKLLVRADDQPTSQRPSSGTQKVAPKPWRKNVCQSLKKKTKKKTRTTLVVRILRWKSVFLGWFFCATASDRKIFLKKSAPTSSNLPTAAFDPKAEFPETIITSSTPPRSSTQPGREGKVSKNDSSWEEQTKESSATSCKRGQCVENDPKNVTTFLGRKTRRKATSAKSQ